MKKVALLVVGIILWCGVKAQVPNFAFDSARWVVYGTLPHETRTVYTTGYDTIVSGKTYTTIWTDFYDGSLADTNNLELLIRPDTSNRVWFRYPLNISSDTNEYVLYDFSLQVGDTFIAKGSLNLGVDTFVVFNTASGQLNDLSSVNVIQFTSGFSSGCSGPDFMEMVGCGSHPFYPLLGISTFSDTCIPTVNCYQVNGQCLYGTASLCDYDVGATEYESNPCEPSLIVSDESQIIFDLDCLSENMVELSIYDCMGQVIYHISTKESMVSITLPRGLFIACFQSDDQLIVQRLIH